MDVLRAGSRSLEAAMSAQVSVDGRDKARRDAIGGQRAADRLKVDSSGGHQCLSNSMVRIDSSAGMIQSASRHERSSLAFRHVDVRASTYRDAFDIIFSNATLHWIKNREQLLLSLHQGLKSGGVLRVNFAGAGNSATLNRIAMALMTSATFRAASRGSSGLGTCPRRRLSRIGNNVALARVDIWGRTPIATSPTRMRCRSGWRIPRSCPSATP